MITDQNQSEHDENRDEEIPPDVMARLREEEDMQRFYARRRQWDDKIESVKRTYGVSTPKVWRNLVWLGFAFLVIAVVMGLMMFL